MADETKTDDNPKMGSAGEGGGPNAAPTTPGEGAVVDKPAAAADDAIVKAELAKKWDTIARATNNGKDRFTDNEKRFLVKLGPAMEFALKKEGLTVPAEGVVGQLALESAKNGNWGTSDLALNSNNFAGLTAGSSWKGPTVVKADKQGEKAGGVTLNQAFRRYATPEDFAADYAKFIQQPRYAVALQQKDPYSYAVELGRAGYHNDNDAEYAGFVNARASRIAAAENDPQLLSSWDASKDEYMRTGGPTEQERARVIGDNYRSQVASASSEEDRKRIQDEFGNSLMQMMEKNPLLAMLLLFAAMIDPEMASKIIDSFGQLPEGVRDSVQQSLPSEYRGGTFRGTGEVGKDSGFNMPSPNVTQFNYDLLDPEKFAKSQVYPVEGQTDRTITSPFGPRNIAHGSKNHPAWDLRGSPGTGVLSLFDGKITEIGQMNVTVQNSNGTITKYLHVDGACKVGQEVKAGDKIATILPKCARSPYDPHLDVRTVCAKSGVYINPSRYMDYEKLGIKYGSQEYAERDSKYALFDKNQERFFDNRFVDTQVAINKGAGKVLADGEHELASKNLPISAEQQVIALKNPGKVFYQEVHGDKVNGIARTTGYLAYSDGKTVLVSPPVLAGGARASGSIGGAPAGVTSGTNSFDERHGSFVREYTSVREERGGIFGTVERWTDQAGRGGILSHRYMTVSGVDNVSQGCVTPVTRADDGKLNQFWVNAHNHGGAALKVAMLPSLQSPNYEKALSSWRVMNDSSIDVADLAKGKAPATVAQATTTPAAPATPAPTEQAKTETAKVEVPKDLSAENRQKLEDVKGKLATAATVAFPLASAGISKLSNLVHGGSEKTETAANTDDNQFNASRDKLAQIYGSLSNKGTGTGAEDTGPSRDIYLLSQRFSNIAPDKEKAAKEIDALGATLKSNGGDKDKVDGLVKDMHKALETDKQAEFASAVLEPIKKQEEAKTSQNKVDGLKKYVEDNGKPASPSADGYPPKSLEVAKTDNKAVTAPSIG